MTVDSLIQSLPVGRLFKFACVGFAGFAVDTGSLALLHHGFGLDPFTARIISIALAIFSTWRLNRSVTFGRSDTGQVSEGARYYGVALVTAGVNFSIYSAILLIWTAVWPVAAAVAATAVTMFMSYFGYSRLVFRTGNRG
jgi:putative flippase GtrA